MDGRARILESIAHHEPDRVARDLGATPSSGISAIAYHNLMRHTRWQVGPTKIYDIVQQLAQPDELVLDRLGIDVVDIGRAFNDTPADWKPYPFYADCPTQIPTQIYPVADKSGSFSIYKNDIRIAHMPAGSTFFNGSYIPYPDEIPRNLSDLDAQMDLILWQSLASAPWDHRSDPDFWRQLRERALTLHKSGRALMIVCSCNLFEWGCFLRRMDNFFCDIMTNEKGVVRLLDALLERHLAILDKVCQAVGDVADVLQFGDDLGTDSGPFIQPALYRKLFKPFHMRLNAYVHQHSQMKTFLHSCGSLYLLLPDLIEAGYDIINPVQLSARDMEAGRLKREFGNDITFWGGGGDTRNVLHRATAQQVRDHTVQLLDTFAPGGGFVFSAVHNIRPDVPPENILAMFEALDSGGSAKTAPQMTIKRKEEREAETLERNTIGTSDEASQQTISRYAGGRPCGF